MNTHLDRLIPAPCRKDAHLRCVHPLHHLDRRLVLRDLRRLPCCDVEHTTDIVCPSGKYLVPLLKEHGSYHSDYIEKKLLTLFQQTLNTGPW